MKATKIRKTRLQRGTQQAAKLGPSGTAGGLMDAVLSAVHLWIAAKRQNISFARRTKEVA
ncbi:MAG: hypothetical protein ACLU3I_13800 [Acutalibacteraceae bacterium]